MIEIRKSLNGRAIDYLIPVASCATLAEARQFARDYTDATLEEVCCDDPETGDRWATVPSEF